MLMRRCTLRGRYPEGAKREGDHDTWLVHCDRMAGMCSGGRRLVVVGHHSRTYAPLLRDCHVGWLIVVAERLSPRCAARLFPAHQSPMSSASARTQAASFRRPVLPPFGEALRECDRLVALLFVPPLMSSCQPSTSPGGESLVIVTFGYLRRTAAATASCM